MRFYFYLAVYHPRPLLKIKNMGTEHDGPKEHYAVHLDEIIVSTPMKQKISDYAKPVTVLHDDNFAYESREYSW